MNVAISSNVNRMYRISVSVFFFIAGITFATWASRIPDIKNSLHLNEAAFGTVLFALPAGLMVSLPLSGWLVTRFGSRRMMITGALLYPLILVLIGAMASTWQLVFGLFIFGMFGNLMNISMNTQAVGIEALYGRSIMASFHGLWSLAGFTGAAIGTLFVSAGILPLPHFASICILVGLLVLVFFRYTLPHDVGRSGSHGVFVIPDKYILKLGLIAFSSMICEGAMADWIGVYFQKVVESPKALTTLGYVAFTFTMATGRFLADWLITKLGVKRMLQISGMLITSGLLVAVLFPFLYSATIGCLLVGFGVSAVVPIAYGLAGKSTTMSPGLALAAVSSISFLGFLIGPPVIGLIAEASSLRWSFTLVAFLGLGTCVMAGSLKTK